MITSCIIFHIIPKPFESSSEYNNESHHGQSEAKLTTASGCFLMNYSFQSHRGIKTIDSPLIFHRPKSRAFAHTWSTVNILCHRAMRSCLIIDVIRQLKLFAVLQYQQQLSLTSHCWKTTVISKHRTRHHHHVHQVLLHEAIRYYQLCRTRYKTCFNGFHVRLVNRIVEKRFWRCSQRKREACGEDDEGKLGQELLVGSAERKRFPDIPEKFFFNLFACEWNLFEVRGKLSEASAIKFSCLWSEFNHLRLKLTFFELRPLWWFNNTKQRRFNKFQFFWAFVRLKFLK